MDIRQLKYFVTIAEEGTITKAAERLFMAQPPLSRQLKLMETELGVPLFDRTNKKSMILTPEGRVFLKNARRIVYNLDEAVTEVKELGQQMTKRLSIGTTIYCSEIVLPVLKDFCERYPFIVPEIHEGNVSHLMDLLKNHTIELAFSARPFDAEGYTIKALATDDCVIVVSKNFGWAKECISLKEISQLPLLLLNAPDSNSFYQKILHEFEKRDLKLNISCVCNDSGLLLKLILGDFGASILPESMINEIFTQHMRIIPIKDSPWTMEPNLIWRKEGYRSSTLKEFIKRF
ncbi:MAG: LysR family transcriptional regulator [Clostridiaceae bacterium]